MDYDDDIVGSLEHLDDEFDGLGIDMDEPIDDQEEKLRNPAESDDAQPDAEAEADTNTEADDPLAESPSSEPQTGRNRIEVAIPSIPQEERDEYATVHSNIVEAISAELPAHDGQLQCLVVFTDGREELVSFSDLVTLENGKAAFARLSQGLGQADGDMARHKRKRDSEDEWDTDVKSVASDPMDLDEDESDEQLTQRRRVPSRPLRSRTSTRQTSKSISIVSGDDELNDHDNLKPVLSTGPSRTLRTRQPRQVTLTSMSFSNHSGTQDQDELLNEPAPVSSDDDDADFFLVTSDIGPKNGRPNKARMKSKRLQTLHARSKAQSSAASRRQRSHDSDIEFEAPRRSVRSTRNKNNMQDEALMDEDSFYVVDDKAPGAPKVISIREVFQPSPPESAFSSMHMDTCHTCGGSRQRGQMIHCQGCTLSYHKNCLGFRSARDHMVTKVGEDNFVLQCKFCVGVYTKKDVNAPAHGMCQGCRVEGRACSPFSAKKTARQEEKLREENEGVDPITTVSSRLLNNADLVLFRCATCRRAWHVEHLPGEGGDAVGTDLKSERLKDYSIDWQCEDCSTSKHKIHRLVAWRPSTRILTATSPRPSYNDVKEDDKEYLIKWESLSYVHCTWKLGAWVHGVAPSTMRVSFGKRDLEHDLLKVNEKEAIPDEYITPDIIFHVKMQQSAPRSNSREADFANMSRVSKVLVKFQGLGYDDVVWDSPPKENMTAIHSAFVEAYYEYVQGKYFRNDSQSKVGERIKAFKAAPFVELAEQPAGLKRGKLMGYQVEGLNWLLGNYHSGRSVVLADEMGLGKTVQVVSMVTTLVQDKPQCWPFLVVVPNATCPNWRREFKQWAPDLRVVTYHGGREPQELAYKHELFPDNSPDMKAHVVIMSYDSAADPRTKNLFKSVNWTGLVVDEGQRLKNDQNLLYVALRSMKIPFRLLLTGTPLQNNKRELFNLIQFIDETQDATQLDEQYQVLDKETLPKLHEKIRPYFLRRTKAGVLKFLPPMSQIILPVTMTTIQEKLARSIMAKNPQLIKAMFANSRMNKKERGSLSNILMQLRKCLCHPFMYSEAIEEKHHDREVMQRNLVEASAKLLLLEKMLVKLKERGHRVLLFSQFLQQLDIIEDFLTGLGFEYRRLDGNISSLEKQRRIDAFNAPDSPLFAFLLSTRAGGVGINLATADTVIILDPDFNPHQDLQALSRAHRIGQKKKVLCFQIVTKDSVEERIMQIGRKKMALDHALIESMDDDNLAGDDLESILRHGAQALFDDNYEKQAIHYDAASIDKLLDRAQNEELKSADEGAGEGQFAHAQVWANDKSGFEDALATEEQDEPMPINSSVWDRILAEREEEAKREAEANRELLGRGNRRRTNINYKTNVADAVPLLGDPELESSDSSDDFAGGAESADDTDEEEEVPSSKGKRQKSNPPQQRTPAPTPTKKAVKNNSVNRRTTQTPKNSSLRSIPSKRTTKTPAPATPKRGKTPTPKALSVPKPKKASKGVPEAAPASREAKQQRIPVRSSQKAKAQNDAATDGKKGTTEKRQASAKVKASSTPLATDSKSASPQAPSGQT
ncbi:PHD/FYVE-zinc-finger like domain-containing protein [Dactylonectria macrodidyma]|uniref:PHD/FYVE-zinc-finger like domain-containing protein n=1 Tax=Dactylonectria macrodidyma TaxID=307937 RepID=A0A9P9EY86_9HYPO|nr:PHD/FYVE-zinc-finger like domain-containing protein [Dactylonectria macrodidyma]